MILDELIYDRTIADVNHVLTLIHKGYDGMTDAEKIEWNSDLKGALNASDLNRVLEASEYVAEQMKVYGYYARFKEARPGGATWTENDIQDELLMSNYLHNIKQALQYGPLLSLPITTKNLDYIGQNNIEKHLHETARYMTNAEAVKIHANTVCAGFQGGLRR